MSDIYILDLMIFRIPERRRWEREREREKTACLNYLRSSEFLLATFQYIGVFFEIWCWIKADANGRGSWHVPDLIENHWRWFSSRWAILMRCLSNISKPPCHLKQEMVLTRLRALIRSLVLSACVKNLCAGWRTRIKCIESETISNKINKRQQEEVV